MLMARKALKILFSLLAAILFLWLAFREVDLPELWQQITEIRLWWLLPFTVVMMISHFLRAERWLLLLQDLENKPPRSTLFAGVMVGYMMNNVFPRLGEVSRPLYVGRQMKLSTSKLLGTIVLERIIDLVCLIAFLIFISFYFISDQQVIGQIFGTESWTVNVFIIIPLILILLFISIWAAFKLLTHLHQKGTIKNPFFTRFIEVTKLFWKGLLSVREVKNWPMFMVYTLGIWAGYTAMAYLPFTMLDLQLIYNLGFIEAMVITVISAVGVVIPTPGGIGSYHLFIQQSLWLLFSVPLVTALTYATITHAATVLLIFITGAAVLWFDKYYTLKTKLVR
jgi:glycosyltransferase 2 family protein